MNYSIETLDEVCEIRQAREMVQNLGYVDALAHAKRCRDLSSMGTFTYASHNRIVRHLEQFATVGKIQ